MDYFFSITHKLKYMTKIISKVLFFIHYIFFFNFVNKYARLLTKLLYFINFLLRVFIILLYLSIFIYSKKEF